MTARDLDWLENLLSAYKKGCKRIYDNATTELDKTCYALVFEWLEDLEADILNQNPIIFAKYKPSFKNVSEEQSQSVGYGDAVEAIVNSDMLGTIKSEAVLTILKGEDADYYKAGIAIVNADDMLGSTKLTLIADMSK